MIISDKSTNNNYIAMSRKR